MGGILNGSNSEGEAEPSAIPGLLLLLGKIEKRRNGEARDRLQSICNAMASNIPIENQTGDGTIYHDLMELLFSDNEELRKPAEVVMKEWSKEPPKDLDVKSLISLLVTDGDWNIWMMTKTKKGDVKGLKSWQLVVKTLGSLLHETRSTSLVNGLLVIVEKGFKSENQDVRREAFSAWQTLIDNFAMDPHVLLQSKRIKLLVRPLVSNQALRLEKLARSKLETWWHLIISLGENVGLTVESVVIPFLEFCYGRNSDVAVTPSKSPVASPLKKFSSLSPLCLDAFAGILGCQEVSNSRLPRLNIQEEVLKTQDIVLHHATLFNCIDEAFEHLQVGNHTDHGKFCAIFSKLSLSMQIISTSDNADNIKTISSYLRTMVQILDKGRRNSRLHSVIFASLHNVLKLPLTILLSKTYCTQLEQPLSTYLIELCMPEFAMDACSQDEAVREQYLDTLKELLLKGSMNKTIALSLIEDSVTKLCGNVASFKEQDRKMTLANVWKVLSEILKEHVQNTQEVNQLSSTLEYNISACQKVLILPLEELIGEPVKGIWKQWLALYSEIIGAASLVVPYQAFDLESNLCQVMTSQFDGRNKTDKASSQFEVYSHILAAGIIKEMKFSTLSIKSLKSFKQVVEFTLRLLDHFKTHHFKINKNLKDLATVCTTLLIHTKLKEAKHLLVDQLIPHLTSVLDASYNLEKEDEEGWELVEKLSESSLAAVKNFHDLDLKLLNTLKSFMISGMQHPKRALREKFTNFWCNTFELSVPIHDIPKEIVEALHNSLVISNESSSQTSLPEDDNPVLFTNRVTKINDHHIRGVGTPDKKNKPIMHNSPRTVHFKVPSKSHKRISLEDESSQDFVRITQSQGSNKKRPLTEHQKEKMRYRRDDIPALYSELSRDDSSQLESLPSQFDSQSLPLDEEANDFHSGQSNLQKESEHNEDTDSGKDAPSDVSDSQSKVNDGNHAKKRKGRPPVKNLAPLTRRKSTNTTTPESTAKRKRGRPPKKQAASEDVVESPKKIGTVEVELTRLSPKEESLVKISPVKVIQEQPLVLEPIVPSSKVIKELNFEESSDRNVEISNKDSDFIESSQSSEEQPLRGQRGRKRKRESTNVSINRKTRRNANLSSPFKKFMTRSATASKKSISIDDKENNKSLVQRKGKNKYGETLLHVAVRNGNLDRIKSLLEEGADVNASDHAGWMPIHEAIRELPNSIEIIQTLLDHGANINGQAENGNTPLHDAVSLLSDRMVQFLIENGADPKLSNKEGTTPFDLASDKIKTFLQPTDLNDGTEKSQPPEQISEHFESNSQIEASPVVPEIMPQICNDEGEDHSKELDQSFSLETDNASESNNKENEIQNEESSKNLGVRNADEVQPKKDVISKNEESQKEKIVPFPAPLPRIVDKQPKRCISMTLSGRGAKLLEMSKAKSQSNSNDKEETSAKHSSSPVMSPRVNGANSTQVNDMTVTPKGQKKPWERYQPSPSDASPSSSILKKSLSLESATLLREEGECESPLGPPSKRRRVQFMDPPVSEKVEIPRSSSSIGKSLARQRLSTPRFFKEIATTKLFSSDDSFEEETGSLGLYESTPPIDLQSKGPIYPSLVDCEEPVTAILTNLANMAWQKAAEKSLTENKILKIGHIAKLTSLEVQNIKGLKPPNNLTTILDALKKFEKKRDVRLWNGSSGDANKSEQSTDRCTLIAEKIASILDTSTPEEDEQAIQELYERPSPSPTEISECNGLTISSKIVSASESMYDSSALPKETSAFDEPCPSSTSDKDIQAVVLVTSTEMMTEAKQVADFSNQVEQPEYSEISSQTDKTSLDDLFRDISNRSDHMEHAELWVLMNKCIELTQKCVQKLNNVRN